MVSAKSWSPLRGHDGDQRKVQHICLPKQKPEYTYWSKVIPFTLAAMGDMKRLLLLIAPLEGPVVSLL